MKSSTDLMITMVTALFLVGGISSLPTKKAVTSGGITTATTLSKAEFTPAADNKGYIRMVLDDPQLKELAAYATEEIRLRQQSPDLSLKGIVFALKQISTSNNFKVTLVLAKTGEKPSQSLLCNVDVVVDGTNNERRLSKADCIRANIVSGIQSISSDGTFQEDADLAAAIFAATEFNRQNNSSSLLTLLHYTASGSLEMISGTEYKLQMQMSDKKDQVLLCDTNVLPRTPRILHGVECSASAGRTDKDDVGSYNAADVKDADVKETAEFAANSLTERQVHKLSTAAAGADDLLSLVKVAKAWKKPVRGIQRRLRMTLSNEGITEPSSYCLAVVFEDRLSGEYELVNGPGTTVCSSTPPTA
jgi:hypothetical protein